MQVGICNKRYCEVGTGGWGRWGDVDGVGGVGTQCREGYFSYGR